MRMMPHLWYCDRALLAGPEGTCEISGSTTVAMKARYSRELSRHCLDARDHFVDGLVRRPIVVDDTAHRLGPHVFIVENRELVVLREFEGDRSCAELIEHRFTMRIGLPER